MGRSTSNFRRPIRCMHVGDRQYVPLDHRGIDDGLPGVVRDPAAALPSVNGVVFLANGDRQMADRHFRRTPNRKYVAKGLHSPSYTADYLSAQGRTEKQVTPLFRQLTMLDMTVRRKQSTPTQWRKDFIARVKAARIMSGLKPVEVAAELGIPLDTYNRWETRALLPHHLLLPFCRATGTDPVLLLTGSPLDLGKLLSQQRRA